MTNLYSVFLHSDDVDRLTHEAYFPTEEEAKAAVQAWLGDDDWDEELAAGRFRIDELLNGHLKGAWHVNIVARTAEYMKACQEFSTTIIDKTNEAEILKKIEEAGKKQKVVLQGNYPTYEKAMLEVDRAIDSFLFEADDRLYGRMQRENRSKGIHQKFITDAAAFGFQIYAGEYAIRYRYSTDTTIEDLRAVRFKPEGLGKISQHLPFTVESGALRVSDPCYEMGIWCAGTTEKVLNGKWLSHIQYFHEAFDSYSLERWNEMLEEFENGQPELTKLLADASGDIDEKRLEHLTRLIKQRSLESIDSYGNPDDWRGRVAYLHIRHESVLEEPIDLSLFTRSEINVGVDSGQAGFFDLDKYVTALSDKSDNSRDKSTRFEKFYDACGVKTLGNESWGTVEGFGVASMAGFGDGSYTLLERRNKVGELVEARIVYIGEAETADEE